MRGAWLGIDTVSNPGGVAVAFRGATAASRALAGSGSTSETLLASVHGALESVGTTGHLLGGIAFVLGPGSYTGLRIAAATAQGLSAGWGVPLKGVPTLRLIAFGTGSAGPVLVAMRARKGEVFAALYGSADPFSKELVPAGIYDASEIVAIASTESPKVLGSGRLEMAGAGLNWLPECLDNPDPGLCAVLGELLASAEGFDRNPEPLYLRGFMQKAGHIGH